MKRASLNHVYRVVRDTNRNITVVVSECASTRKKGSKKIKALALAILGLSAGSPVMAADPIVNDAENGSGAFVGTARSASNSVSFGNSSQQTIFTGYNTTGGAGSGGGAGLGGVFFVDQGAALTLINSALIGNRVTGGQGGSLPASRLGDAYISASPLTLDLNGYEQQLAKPDLVYNSVAGTYSFSSVTVGTGTSLFNAGSNISFNELNTPVSATISSVTSSQVLLSAAITLSASDIESTGEADVTRDGNGVVTTINTSGYEIDGNTIYFYEATEGDLSDLLSQVAINNQVYIDGEGAVIQTVNYGNGGVISSITLDRAITPAAADLDLIAINKFTTQLFNISGSTVNVTSQLRGFRVGMKIYDENGDDTGAVITSVANDGASFTVNNATLLSGVTSISAQ